jgi:ribosomal protein S18 acetylase RimI-like enzyme
MILRDWSDLSGEVLAPIYDAERRRWLQLLQWDSLAACGEIEHARVTWGLPGFVAIDHAGRIRGMAYYLLEADRIDIGAIVSESDAATDVLLDGILTVADALDLGTVRALTLDAAAALGSALNTRDFHVEPHLYLSRRLQVAEDPQPSRAERLWARLVDRTTPVVTPGPLDAWQDDDVEPAAALLARSYDRASGSLFAPNHEAGEWSRYVRNLVTHVGCGVLNRQMTQVLREGDDIRALALITDIAPRVAHLVQLAVDPTGRGARVGEALVERSCQQLREAGYDALTLLVASTNAPARALYDRLGFRHDSCFLAASLDARATRGARQGAPVRLTA